MSIEKLLKEFFNYTSVIAFQHRLEGQRIEDDGTILIGDRAGPECHVLNLCHEMAHFVEIDDERMQYHGWGLRVPEVYIMGQSCIEPTTSQITQRELRVATYQYNILKYINVEKSIDELVSSFVFLPDTAFIPLENGELPYVEDRTHNLEYDQIRESQHKWRVNEVKNSLKEYSMDRFVSEWFRKIKLLESKRNV